MSNPYRGNNPDYGGDSDRDHFVSRGYDAAPPSRPTDRMVSGVATVQSAAGLTTRPQQGTQIVRWMTDDQAAIPVVVHVDVKGSGTPTPTNPFAAQATWKGGGDGTGDTSRPAGVLRLTYGAGNAVRVVDLDLRSGTYQLPPSTTCTVEAFFFQTGPLKATVAASIVAGLTEAPTRAFNSMELSIVAGGSQSITVPHGARWIGLMGGGATGIGAGQPNLVVTFGARNPTIIQDWTTGTFVGAPGDMIEMPDRSTVTVKNNGATTALVTVRFAIEL